MQPDFDRTQGIGASDSGSALGVNPYKTPFDLWQEKTKKITPPDLSDNPHVKRGIRMEPIIRDWVKEDLGITIRKDNKTHFSEEYPFLYSHTDGFIQGKKRIAEIKAPSLHMLNQYGEEGTDEIPDYYLTQGIHMMLVQPEIEGVDYFIQFPGLEIKQYLLDRSDHMIKNYKDAITRFWDFVVHDTPPPPINNNDVSQMYSTSNGQMMPWDAEVETLIQKLIKIKSKHKEEKEQLDSLGVEIKNRIGNYDFFTLKTGGKVRLNRIKKFNEAKLREINEETYSKFLTKFDKDAFKKSDKDLYEECRTTIQVRLDLPRTNPS